ncbi:GNAT family N-acetyltransferase [Ensifer sp.]|jgi:GNAT superfamily N-acetyltransferase|uniref:GNAT family N-acetyltransferase n=1 Tax=Ensifer sp. TaxID=1872086 RepID=UPI002E15BD06|nr:GNAT family N-acetyltransferase [Ensifer sp.]
MIDITIVTAGDGDRSAWNALHAGFAAYYGVPQSDEMRDRVWGWIREGRLECRLALDGTGRPIGLTHFREYIRPLFAARGGFLDDLFVAPEARGSGAAAQLIRAVADIGRERGWTSIRWITRDDNYRARTLYDRVASRTDWITYDITL